MQWDDSHAAGFTTGKPWIMVNSNYQEVNVQEALKDENSIYHYYRELIALRKKHEGLVYGEYKLLLPLDPDLYVYTRKFEEEEFLIILNFFDRTPVFKLPEELSSLSAELLLSNYHVEKDDLHEITFRAYEARIYKLKSRE